MRCGYRAFVLFQPLKFLDLLWSLVEAHCLTQTRFEEVIANVFQMIQITLALFLAFVRFFRIHLKRKNLLLHF